MNPRTILVVVLALIASALLACERCSPPDVSQKAEVSAHPKLADPTAVPPESPPLPEDFKQNQEELLAAARSAYDADPDEPQNLIWIGRRLAYLTRYDEAIDVYSEGLKRWPDLPHFLRHRGHRYLTTRRYESAEEDLTRAAELIRGQDDEIEPDGLPNERGIPTSTLQTNIWYHLGLARYLQADMKGALEAYRECLEVSENPDMESATRHWLYMTLRRLDQPEEARSVLEPVSSNWEIIENHDYHQLLLMYKGEADAAALLEKALGAGDLGRSTSVYGIGNWYLYNGEADRGRELFQAVLQQGHPAAFGYLAAEADLARLTQ